MSGLHRKMAYERALRYNRQYWRGEYVPIVTAAFWDEGEYLTAAFPWREVLDNGAHIMTKEFMEPDIAMSEWQDAYSMSEKQRDFAQSLFERRMASADEVLELSSSEIDWLAGSASCPEAMDYCKHAFAAIEIRL
jgi:hypothetical protein